MGMKAKNTSEICQLLGGIQRLSGIRDRPKTHGSGFAEHEIHANAMLAICRDVSSRMVCYSETKAITFQSNSSVVSELV